MTDIVIIICRLGGHFIPRSLFLRRRRSPARSLPLICGFTSATSPLSACNFGDGARSRSAGGPAAAAASPAPGGGGRCRPRRRGGGTGTPRRPPGGAGRLLSTSAAFAQICSLRLKCLSSSKLSARPCPPVSPPAADLSVDLCMCSSLLPPVLSSTSLFLLFLLILSFPFLSPSFWVCPLFLRRGCIPVILPMPSSVACRALMMPTFFQTLARRGVGVAGRGKCRRQKESPSRLPRTRLL